MHPFIAFILGSWAGCFVGLLVASLCVASKSSCTKANDE